MESNTGWIIRHSTLGRWIAMSGNLLKVTTNPMAAFVYFSKEMAWQDLQGLKEQDSIKFANYEVQHTSWAKAMSK